MSSPVASPFAKIGVLARLTQSLFSNSWQRNIVALQSNTHSILLFETGERFDQFVNLGQPTFADMIDLTGAYVYVTNYLDKTATFEINASSENLYLQACDEVEMWDWIKQLTQHGCKLRAPDSKVLLFRPSGNDRRGVMIQPTVYKQGFLHKRGFFNTAFQKRFFRIGETADGAPQLIYFKSAESVDDPKGVIPLLCAQLVETHDDFESALAAPPGDSKNLNDYLKLSMIESGDFGVLSATDSQISQWQRSAREHVLSMSQAHASVDATTSSLPQEPVPRGRLFVLRSDSEAERNEWLSVLRRLLADNRGSEVRRQRQLIDSQHAQQWLQRHGVNSDSSIKLPRIGKAGGLQDDVQSESDISSHYRFVPGAPEPAVEAISAAQIDAHDHHETLPAWTPAKLAAHEANHYAALGLDPTASQVDVQRAFELLRERIYPYVNQSNSAADAFRTLQEAYLALCDPQRRSDLDASLNLRVIAEASDHVPLTQESNVSASGAPLVSIEPLKSIEPSPAAAASAGPSTSGKPTPLDSVLKLAADLEAAAKVPVAPVDSSPAFFMPSDVDNQKVFAAEAEQAPIKFFAPAAVTDAPVPEPVTEAELALLSSRGRSAWQLLQSIFSAATTSVRPMSDADIHRRLSLGVMVSVFNGNFVSMVTWSPQPFNFLAYAASQMDNASVAMPESITELCVGCTSEAMSSAVRGAISDVDRPLCLWLNMPNQKPIAQLLLRFSSVADRDVWLFLLLWLLRGRPASKLLIRASGRSLTVPAEFWRDQNAAVSSSSTSTPASAAVANTAPVISTTSVVSGNSDNTQVSQRRRAESMTAPFDFTIALRSLSDPGIMLVKVPTGRAKPRKVRCYIDYVPHNDRADSQIPASMYAFRWDSATKSNSEASVLLRDCDLLLGQQTEIFARHAASDASLKAAAEWSLSLRTPQRTIDLIAASLNEYVCLVRVLAKFVPVRAAPKKA